MPGLGKSAVGLMRALRWSIDLVISGSCVFFKQSSHSNTIGYYMVVSGTKDLVSKHYQTTNSNGLQEVIFEDLPNVT